MRSLFVGVGVAVALLLGSTSDASAAGLEGFRTYRGGYGLGTYHYLGFWGEPFPHGYRWSITRACTEYVAVETERGVVTKPVWVCHRRYLYP